MNKNKIKYICLSLLAALIFFHIANNLYFLARNPLAEGKDSYAHISAFSNFKQIIENNQYNLFYRSEKSLLYNLVFVVIDYPPLFYFSAYIMNLLLAGVLLNPGLLINTFYLIILLLSVYAIASQIDPLAAIISSFICSVYPMVFLASRHFSLELALAAITALCVWLLIKTNCFEHRRFCLSLGVFLGLGMLLKQTFLVYISGPIGFYLWKCFFFKPTGSLATKRKINLILCLTLGVLISLFFYYNKAVYVSVFHRAGFNGAVNNGNLFSLSHLTYYFRSLPNTMGLFLLFIMLAALTYIKKIEDDMRYVLILWVLVPLIFFTFIRLKYSEYTIAYLAAFSLITGLVISKIDRKFLRGLVIGSIVISGFLNYYAVSTGKVRNFYATYYPPVPDMNVSYSVNNSESVDQVLRNIAFSRVKIGVFYDKDPGVLIFPTYFIRLIGMNPQKKAQIVDFLFCPDVFWQRLDDFDIMIFVTCSESRWITKQSFNEFIKRVNLNNPNQLSVEQSDIIRLIDLVNDLENTDKLVFNQVNSFETIYIYKRMK